jgi:WD40 repeat protein
VIKIWDSGTGKPLLAIHGHLGTASGLAFSPNGTFMASSGTDQAVRIWDAATGQEVRTLVGHTNLVLDVTFSSDGKRLASASDDGTVKIWDVSTLEGAAGHNAVGPKP